MTSSVMNVTVNIVEESLPPSSAGTSPACATSASTAGTWSMLSPEGSTTNLWSKKVLTEADPLTHSAGNSLCLFNVFTMKIVGGNTLIL